MNKYMKTIFAALLLGVFFLFILLNYNYDKKVSSNVNTFYIFQTGVYENKDNITLDNSITIKDNNYYRVYSAILSNEELINIFKDKFNNDKKDYFIREVILNSELSDKITQLEEEMLKYNKTNMLEINNKILLLYKEYYENS